MAKTKKEIVLENLKKIEQWSAEGKTVRWIAQQLGVGKTLIYDMMRADKEAKDNGEKPTGLQDSVTKGRDKAINRIECSMYESAVGFWRKVKKHAKLKRITYKDGKKLKEWEELVEYEEMEYFRPDATCGIFLLKNWANYANEPVTNELRKRELELKEKQAEAENW